MALGLPYVDNADITNVGNKVPKKDTRKKADEITKIWMCLKFSWDIFVHLSNYSFFMCRSCTQYRMRLAYLTRECDGLHGIVLGPWSSI
jgi:hypothetical protein